MLEDIEEALEIAGGFGRYQIGLAITSFLNYHMGGYSIYSMSFYEKMPHFEC